MIEIGKKIIVDTDIGEDIDDTFALVFLLSSQFIDIKLISVTTGDVRYKATLVAKILTLLNRTDIPIALGCGSDNECYAQKRWIEDFTLSSYQGTIIENVADAYKTTITLFHTISVVALAPFSTLSSVKQILLTRNTPILAMAGSIYKGYFDHKYAEPECNVVTDIPSFKNILVSSLPLTLVPLDVCADIQIDGDLYQQLRKSNAIRASIVYDNYKIWDEDYVGGAKKFDINEKSSILYDLCAVWPVIFSQNFDSTVLPLEISDDGKTIIGGSRNVEVLINIHKKQFMLAASVERFNTDIEKSSDIFKLGIKKTYSLTYILHNPNVSLSVAETGWEQRKAGSSFGPLKRDYYILHAVVRGKGTLYIDDKKKDFKAGECFVVPPNKNVRYSADSLDPCCYYWVGYTGITSKEMTENAGFNEANCFCSKPVNFSEVYKRIKLMTTISSNDQAVSYYLLGQLYILFSKLFTKDTFFENSEKNYVKKAMDFIDTHYEEQISIEDISNYVALERTYLYRLFKKKTGLSPKEYLLNIRIESAKKLLTNTTQSINSIIYSCGYNNYISFFNAFSKKVGVSPKEYREHHKVKTTLL